MMTTNKIKGLAKAGLAAAALVAVSGCMMDDRGGAVLGGALGGGMGAAISQEVGGRQGAVLGGAIGGATGAAVGSNSGASRGGYSDDRGYRRHDNGRHEGERRRRDDEGEDD